MSAAPSPVEQLSALLNYIEVEKTELTLQHDEAVKKMADLVEKGKRSLEALDTWDGLVASQFLSSQVDPALGAAQSFVQTPFNETLQGCIEDCREAIRLGRPLGRALAFLNSGRQVLEHDRNEYYWLLESPCVEMEAKYNLEAEGDPISRILRAIHQAIWDYLIDTYEEKRMQDLETAMEDCYDTLSSV